jgi:hypothetical protein
MSWTFAQDGTPYLKLSTPDRQVTVTSTDNQEPQKIQVLSAYSAHKTLGHYKDPVGYQSQQLRELKIKCEKAADFVAISPLNRSEAWTYYFAIFLPSVGYPSQAAITRLIYSMQHNAEPCLILSRNVGTIAIRNAKSYTAQECTAEPTSDPYTQCKAQDK